MSAIENNKDKGQGPKGQQNQQGKDVQNHHTGDRVQWESGQKEVSTDKERKPGLPDQNPQGSHGQKGVGGKILGQENQFDTRQSGQNPQGNFQQGQSRYQGDQGKMKNENRDVDKDSVSE